MPHDDDTLPEWVFENDEVTRQLARGLPQYMPRGPNSNNYGLLEPIGNRYSEAGHDRTSVYDAIHPERAATVEQLEEIAKLVDLHPQTNESADHYRARVLAEFALTTSEGTIRDVINKTADILGIDPENVDYSEPIVGSNENGTASVNVPLKSVQNSALTQSELGDLIDRIASAGCRIGAITTGTFTYITPSDYNANASDASKGYDGLDNNGNPKDNGGTYAGLIT